MLPFYEDENYLRHTLIECQMCTRICSLCVKHLVCMMFLLPYVFPPKSKEMNLNLGDGIQLHSIKSLLK